MTEEVVITGEVAKANDDKQHIFGWAYVAYDRNGVLQIDKSGERIPNVDDLERMAYQFVLKSRMGSDCTRWRRRACPP